MISGALMARYQARGTVALLAFLAAAAAMALVAWVGAPLPPPILSPTADLLEQALDRRIVEAIADFTMWNRINIAVQCATILLGLMATLLTALVTPQNSERLKIATVSVTAMTAALIAVQSTFHLRENLHTDATALAGLLLTETDYLYAREHLAEAKTDIAALRRDTAHKLIRIRSQRMLSLANIGDSAPGGEPEPQRRRDGE